MGSADLDGPTIVALQLVEQILQRQHSHKMHFVDHVIDSHFLQTDFTPYRQDRQQQAQ
jgi:hypothetical protein